MSIFFDMSINIHYSLASLMDDVINYSSSQFLAWLTRSTPIFIVHDGSNVYKVIRSCRLVVDDV